MIEANNILEIESNFKDIKLKYDLKDSDEIKWSLSYSKICLCAKSFNEKSLYGNIR